MEINKLIDNIKKKISLNNQLKFLEVPTTVNNLKNKIENFLQNI